MKRKKNVTKQELKDNLIKTLHYNSKALDYIENVLNRAKDNYKYKENDDELKETIEILEYIKFSLTYLDNQYHESLKKVGVAIGFNK